MDNCMPGRESGLGALKSFVERRQKELDDYRMLIISLEKVELSPEADEALWRMVIAKLG